MKTDIWIQLYLKKNKKTLLVKCNIKEICNNFLEALRFLISYDKNGMIKGLKIKVVL